MDSPNLKNIPCRRDCPNRTTTCKFDGTCDKYQKYKEQHDAQREKRRIEDGAHTYLAEYYKKRQHTETLKKKRKGSSIQ